MEYVCECGASFERPASFNGHKSHCAIHLEAVGKLNLRELNKAQVMIKTSRTFQIRRENKQKLELESWIQEKHTCERCGIVMEHKYASGRFCSKYCANSRTMSESTKAKIGKSVSEAAHRSNKLQINIDKYLEAPKLCSICSSPLDYRSRRHSTCNNPECLKKLQQLNGIKSAQIQSNTRRSKNEIRFCELCEQVFNQVDHNKAMFNNWDADIIIHDYNIAVLWNGIWHHKKITKKHSLEQVQARDRVKIRNIKECGYDYYIINDFGVSNETFVKEEFEKFLEYIKSKNTLTYSEE